MRKQMKFCIFSILFIVCMTGVAQAGFVSSAADLDFGSFTTINGDATLGLKNEFNEVVVNADGDFFEDSGSAGASADAGILGGFAFASASAQELFASSEVDNEGIAGALTAHSVDYMAQGSGEVRVMVDYNLLLESADVNNQESEIFASASLFDTRTEVIDEVSLNVSGGDNLSLDVPGVLEILLNVADGDSGTLEFTASSFADLLSVELSGTGVSEVPLPPALVLFVSALVGLAAVGRRQIS